MSLIAQIVQQIVGPAQILGSGMPDLPFPAKVALSGNKTLILLAPLATFLVGTLLPSALNEYVLPLLSKRARTRKYLRFIANAVGAYKQEFPERFDDPETTWKNWITPVLQTAADTHQIDPKDPTWKEVENRILNKGLEIVVN